MGLCCCAFAKRKMVKDMSTQTDTLPLIEADMLQKQTSLDLKAKHKSSLETALRLVQQAVEADRSRYYEEALSLYQHALVYFLESLNYEAESESIKDRILSKCKQYLDRAEKLAEYLNTNSGVKRRKSVVLTSVSESVAQWIASEDQPIQQTNESKNAVSRIYRSLVKTKRSSRPSTSSCSSYNTTNNNNAILFKNSS